MSTRRAVPALLASLFAFLFFGLGNYLGARQNADSDWQFAALRAEIAQLKRRSTDIAGTAGTAGSAPPRADATTGDARAAIVADVKRQLQDEMGLLPLNVLRERSASFVELYSYDDRGSSSYGTAGYLGDGYFITVKHGVIALDAPEEGQEARRITSIKIRYKGLDVTARVVDSGNANVEVHPGDWAIIKVNREIDLPPLRIDTSYAYDFAEPIFRLGNDYSKGIILSTGYIGQKTPNGLVTCLTDGHPGVSGGGVLNQAGSLVGIPIGRMQGDYRFSFILPIRPEMFRKVPALGQQDDVSAPTAG
jgi:hypothetical protein